MTALEIDTAAIRAAQRAAGAADLPWSEPGETLGVRERYQWRTLAGLHLTAGDNHRKGPDYLTYVRPDSETPWHVSERVPHPDNPATLTWSERAGGVASSQAAARLAAEDAAGVVIMRRTIPKIVKLGAAWPHPWAEDARRRGDVAWFQVTEAFADEMLGCVPPIYFAGGFFVGEAAAHDARDVPIYSAIVGRGGRWYLREVARDRIAAALDDLAKALR